MAVCTNFRKIRNCRVAAACRHVVKLGLPRVLFNYFNIDVTVLCKPPIYEQLLAREPRLCRSRASTEPQMPVT